MRRFLPNSYTAVSFHLFDATLPLSNFCMSVDMIYWLRIRSTYLPLRKFCKQVACLRLLTHRNKLWRAASQLFLLHRFLLKVMAVSPLNWSLYYGCCSCNTLLEQQLAGNIRAPLRVKNFTGFFWDWIYIQQQTWQN